MIFNRKQFLSGMLSSILLATPSTFMAAQIERKIVHKPDVPFTGTVNEVVDAMLNTARVSEQDTVYDLGCGDGRIVIAAARNYGARGVGVDINPSRIKESKQNAKKAGVDQKLRFITQDFFKTNLSQATVVAIYLDPKVNLRLRPKLLRELKPGARVVSNSFDMGNWKPDQTVKLTVAGSECVVYCWTIPEKIASRTAQGP
jgi:SAM-dependent methyltransferase